MKIRSKQMDAVLRLSGAARFEHFVKVVADRQEAWGLYDGGWALAATDDGTPVFHFGQQESMRRSAPRRSGLAMFRAR